jgi:hypothetical protein
MKRIITVMLMTLLFSLSAKATPMGEAAVAANPNDYALVFFFRSDCPFCHQFAPKLKQLAAQTGTYTYAFSLDNQGIAGFEVPIPVYPRAYGERTNSIYMIYNRKKSPLFSTNFSRLLKSK